MADRGLKRDESAAWVPHHAGLLDAERTHQRRTERLRRRDVGASSWSHQGDEKLVQQLELLACATRARAAGGDGVVEGLLGRIELAQDQ